LVIFIINGDWLLRRPRLALGCSTKRKKGIKQTTVLYNNNNIIIIIIICHRVGPLVDLFRSHVSRSLFKGLPLFLLPVGE